MKTHYTFLLVLFILLFNACKDDEDDTQATDKELVSFAFLKADNPSLNEDIFLDINDDNHISGRMPYGCDMTALVASYELKAAAAFVNGIEQENRQSANDFTNPVEYKIFSQLGDSTVYTVELAYFTGLPVLYINTKNEQTIPHGEYVLGNLAFEGTADFPAFEKNLKIRGRGNSTWGSFPKKPYQIKFEEKTPMLDMPADKRWLLLANYSDKTMIRNQVAFELGYLSVLDWTPQGRFIELVLNGDYQGTYQLTQKVEESSDRVDISDHGYLLEVDQLERLADDDVFFETSEYLFNIKEPKVEFNDPRYNYIRDHIVELEHALFNEHFDDPEHGYARYIDAASFADWYLINEIAKNNDAIFYTSVYMNMEPGGKLKMGPIWDFDIAFGNINYNSNETPEGFWIKNASWINRLLEDDAFVDLVKERFAYFLDNKGLIHHQIEHNRTLLKVAQEENDNTWHTIGMEVWPNYMVFDTYDEEVDYLKDWIDQRLDWLAVEIELL